MTVKNICEHSWGANCYGVFSDGHAVIIDPSVSVTAIADALAKENASLDCILLTHGHFDHVMTLDALRDATHAPAFIHADDAQMLTDGKKNAFFDFFGKERVYRAAEKTFADGDVINVGSSHLRVIHTPGHTPGSVCFHDDDDGILFTGDTLFSESFGRCDLWGGNTDSMKRSLAHMRTLNGKLTIYPGHGDTALLSGALDNVAYLI